MSAVLEQDVYDATKVAVVIPIFKHSVLLIDALESALAQDADFGINIVLVNDGCPHRETDQVCREYATAYPGRVTYLRKKNGGLSDARNFGIRYALSRWPALVAVYLLDADNQLRAPALRKAMNALLRAPGADWVYPSIDMFGVRWEGDYGGDYSLLVHTAQNVCEAGSLIHRRVFDGGVFFDTDFKLGFEDWDFFLTAGSRGFRGYNLDDIGFRYRKRPESMLADSSRDEAVIAGAMRAKHKALMATRSLVALEHKEAPRYAIYEREDDTFLLTVDPEQGGRRLSRQEFVDDFWRATMAPGRYHAPQFVVLTSRAATQVLSRAGLLHWALWLMESTLGDTHFTGLCLEAASDDRYRVERLPGTDGHHKSAVAIMVRRDILDEVNKDSGTTWIDSLVTGASAMQVPVWKVTLPSSLNLDGLRQHPPAPVDVLSVVHALRAAPARAALGRNWDWRSNGTPWRRRAVDIPRRDFGGAAAYPRIGGSGRCVGFALPLVEFGGVEKVALNMARAMRRRGWSTHLFVIDSPTAAVSAEWREAFDSVSFLLDPGFHIWGESGSHYLGTPVPPWAQHGQHGRAVGMLCWLDVLVNFHCGALSGVMGQLRRQGVKTVLSLHLSDLTEFGRAMGNTYLGLAYEHAYDVFAPCSLQLADWCHAMGVPEEKVIAVPNAASFETTSEQLQQVMAERATRRDDAPLRVLFIGRLDRQKGIERLSAVVQQTEESMGPQIAWRVIGKSVIGHGAPPISPELAAKISPPLTTPQAVADCYAWADVMVLLSTYEGLPLTVLECIRSGVVPVATDVGAVSEVVEHLSNGFLLDPQRPVAECVSALKRLVGERNLLRRLSLNAAADGGRRNWDAACSALCDRLEARPRG